MLQVLNLCKSYKTKSGVAVQALKNVTLRFPNKGMVFILGKSGSGKSTLLNVLGGLDSYDSGDIVIKGVSSQDFSQSDFDSYRNTYLGFVFQEYNLLDNFTIGENIEMALRLQNRKATPEEVDSILKEVDLGDVKNRRTNELSGGQKQRVAIARALIKNPEIIMADEPTGALDSGTGIQIFDLLKSLSQNKLIIVVSHDREFSEKYADRIIEMKDGEVISDTIKVSKGKVTKFVETDQNAVESDASGFKLIKSRLPLGHAIRMGLSGLKHKKFKLGLTILLSTIAFTALGVATSMSLIDKDPIMVNTLGKLNYNCDIAKLCYTYKNDGSYHQYINEPSFSTDLKETINNKLGDITRAFSNNIIRVDTGGWRGIESCDFYNHIVNHDYNSNNKFNESTSNFYDEKAISDFNLNIHPFGSHKGGLKEDEMYITNFMYDMFRNYGYKCFVYETSEEWPYWKEFKAETSTDVEEYFENGSAVYQVQNPNVDYSSNPQDAYFSFKIVGCVDITPQFDYNNEKYKGHYSYTRNDDVLYQEYVHYKENSFANATFMSTQGVENLCSKKRDGYNDPSYVSEMKVETTNAIFKLTNNKELLSMCYKDFPLTAEDQSAGIESIQLILSNSFLNNVCNVFNNLLKNLRPVFLYAGLAFLLFSALLLSNYIANSISYQKREIGILRAIGSKSNDVFKIYFSESSFLSIITFILSSIASGILVLVVLNPKVAFIINGVNMMNFGIINILVILGVALLSSIIATFIPANHIAKKKPVDAIKNR